MDKEKALNFIENSFLNEMILDENITDISFNGDSLNYLHNLYGRKLSRVKISQTQARDFIRQIANLCDKQFSYQVPSFDATIGKYRINAIHQSIGRKNGEESLCFAIRVASSKPRISDSSEFLSPELVCLFEVLLKSGVSIVISGLTGSGKTEFQKYLISKMPQNTRIIAIDNVLELDGKFNNENLDFNLWQIDDKNTNHSIQLLVKNALRSNPDWLIVAESRGQEMVEVLNSAMTGHPIITTIHAYDINSIPHRMTRMVMMGDTKSNYDEILSDIKYHFRFYVFLRHTIDENGVSKRFISEIGEITNSGMNIIYDYNDKRKYKKISKENLKLLTYDDELFIKTFVMSEDNA